MNTYPSKEYLESLRETLEIHLLSGLPMGIKPKRENQMKATYGNTYSIQVGASSIVGLIEVSHLLGMNDVVIPHIINEYGQLNFALKKLETELKPLKQFNEISEQFTKVSSALRTKDIGKFLYDDLEYLSGVCELESDIDLKQCMADFKSFKPEPSLLLQLGLPIER